MSDQSKATMDAAITAHIAELSDGDYVTDYALIVACVSTDNIGTGTTSYIYEAPDTQAPHTGYGLLTLAVANRAWVTGDGDDE